MSIQRTVMISSTARDLPDYREQVKEACLRAEMLPKMMEHLPASDADAIEASLDLVDKADIYVGLFAHRYGYVPEGHDKSITQMEYERAVERGMPRLIFLIGDKVRVLPEDFDLGESALKLKALKDRLKKERVVGFFKNPDHLHSQVLHSLDRIGEQFKEEKDEAEPAAVIEPPMQPEPEEPLPPLPSDIELPISPYRRLEYFERKDARVFFGRSKEIRELYEALTEPWTAPIVLFFGESGVGKSSLLSAGVQPRLEATHEIMYVRRDSAMGLTSTLAGALQATPEGIAAAWHALEERREKPLIIILDQVEELFTRPAEEADELGLFLKVLDSLFAIRPKRPRGKLLLGFRKEWIAEIEKRLTKSLLPHDKVFLERLTSGGISEVVRGPERSELHRRRYRLSVEEGLPEMIASNLLKDLTSPVGPTLSILLHEMWERVKNDEQPAFTKQLYREYEAKGLGDYLDEQIAALREWNTEVVDSGFALDVLNHHTTDLGTAAARSLQALRARYPDREALLDTLLEESQEKYLLVSSQKGKQPESITRLAHDTLAPLVRQRHKDSNAPGQRAERVLQSRVAGWKQEMNGTPLDETGLSEVEGGQAGMRIWNEAEERLVSASRQRRHQRRMQRYALLGMGVVFIGALGWLYQYINRHNVCTTAGTQLEWCWACIDYGGKWDETEEGTDRYCIGASFDIPDIKTDFVDIPRGSFIREDGVEISITIPVKMGKTEVTQGQWYAVMGNNPSHNKGYNLPVENVSWYDTQQYVDSLNVLDSSADYALPTEAQWEYACLGGTSGPYGFPPDSLDVYAWTPRNTNETQAVRKMRPNDYGLYDMSGNVAEWVADYYGPYDSTKTSDPASPESGEYRVLRGGSFD